MFFCEEPDDGYRH